MFDGLFYEIAAKLPQKNFVSGTDESLVYDI